MSKLVMGYWDCPICGTKEIRGDVSNCPSCGRARGDVKFYVKGYTEGQSLREDQLGQFEQLDDKKAEEMGSNPDWYCSFCNSLNSDNAQVCSNCGATRADSEANYFDRLKKKQEEEAAELAARPQPQAEKKPKSKLLFVILAVLAILLVVWLMPKTKPGTIKSFAWAQQIQTEDYREVTEEDWSVPSGGEIVSQQQKVHHYDSVQTGTREETRSRSVIDHYETKYRLEDNGNGSFSQVPYQVPVYGTEYYTVEVPVYTNVPRYQTAYTYKIWRWTAGETLKTSGNDHTAVWAELPEDENKREKANGRYGEYYFSVLNDKGEEIAYCVAESNWQKNAAVWESLQEGQPVKIQTSGGSVTLQDENKNKIANIVEVR